MKKYFYVLFISLSLISFTAFAKESVFELSTASIGVVDVVNVKAGKKVKKGQVLLKLDQRVYKAKLDEAISALQSMSLNFKEAKKELERAEELFERTVLSDHDLSVAKITFAKAEASLKKIERMKIEAQYNFDHSQLLAPFSGRIKSVIAFPGMLVINQLKPTVLVTMEK